MRVHEILSAEQLLEMSYSRKKAEAVITNLEKPINDHFLKLLLVEDTPDREHWMKEPFGGTGEVNVARRIRRLERQGYTLLDDDLNNVLQRLQRFHKKFSDACHRGVEADEINAMLTQMANVPSGEFVCRHKGPSAAR
jgi:hypothetical protein